MSTEGQQPVRDTIVAANDFRVAKALYKAVNEAGEFTKADDAYFAGVAISQPNSGQHLSIVRQGIVKAYLGGAVSSAGDMLTLAASGFFALAGSGDVGVGRVLETCASGDLARCFIDATRGPLVAT